MVELLFRVTGFVHSPYAWAALAVNLLLFKEPLPGQEIAWVSVGYGFVRSAGWCLWLIGWSFSLFSQKTTWVSANRCFIFAAAIPACYWLAFYLGES